MKKFILSAVTILSFGLYSLHKTFGEGSGVTTPVGVPNDLPSTIPTQNQTDNPTMMPQGGGMQQGMMGKYKNGNYIGDNVDAYYGFVQVQIKVSQGKIIDVVFLSYPNDRNTSIFINSQAMPYLKQEAIAAQNAQVDIVGGATQTSLAFRQSLQSALDKAI